VVLRDGNPTLLQDKHIKASDVRLYAAPPAAQAVDLEQFRDSVLEEYASSEALVHESPEEEGTRLRTKGAIGLSDLWGAVSRKNSTEFLRVLNAYMGAGRLLSAEGRQACKIGSV
jgi:hypothetical protein